MFREMSFNLNQKKALSKSDNCPISVSADGNFVIYKIGDEPLQYLEISDKEAITKRFLKKSNPDAGNHAFALSPDARLLATYRKIIHWDKSNYSEQTFIDLWDVRSRKLAHELVWDFVFPNYSFFISGDLQFSQDSKQLIATTKSGEIAIWNTVTGKLLRFVGQAMLSSKSTAIAHHGKFFASFEINNEYESGIEGPASAISVGRYYQLHGTLYAYNSRVFYEDSRENGEWGWGYSLIRRPLGTTVVGWIPDNQKQIFKLWDAYSGAEIHDFEMDGETHDLQFSYDDALLAGEVGGAIHLWDVETGLVTEKIRRDSPLHLIGFTSDDRYLVLYDENNTIHIRDIKNQQWVDSYKIDGHINDTAITPTNRIVVSVKSNSWSIHVLDIAP